MSARDRLNSAYTVGVIVAAGLIGLIANSSAAFFIAAGMLSVAAVRSSRIRP